VWGMPVAIGMDAPLGWVLMSPTRDDALVMWEFG
jgi:hypothetical protein